jgi:protein-tyrosine-phosphatase
VPRFVRIQSRNLVDVAGQVVAGLDHGVAVVPMFGGYSVVASRPEALVGFDGPFRLVTSEAVKAEVAGMQPCYRERVLKVMGGQVVAKFASGRPALALATEPMALAMAGRVDGGVWFGVPPEGSEPGELADELGSRVSLVVTGGVAGPGPTGLDFSSRPVVFDRRGKLGILEVEQQLGELVRMGPGLFFSVLVVCTGNSCRSPMAHYMLAKMLEGTAAYVSSAGSDAPAGSPAAANAVEVLREVGLDLNGHRAQQLSPAMLEAADLVLVMEEYHRQRISEMTPEAAGKTRLLLSYAGKEERVEDPIGFSVECYRLTREVMRPALEQVAAEVRQRASIIRS